MDWIDALVICGLSTLLAYAFYRSEEDPRVGLYFALGNIALSLLPVLADGTSSIINFAAAAALSVVAYLAVLGALFTFAPRRQRP